MVEGHSVHRVVALHRRKFVGRVVAAQSPNGRFTDGAAAVHGLVFAGIEAIGKNLFAFFDQPGGGAGGAAGVAAAASTAAPGADTVVVHVHFGMSGAWPVFDSAAAEPPTRPTTRLRLQADGVVSQLSAMTVQHGGLALYQSKKKALGQDPLRPDADPELLRRKIAKSRKNIGQLLMDQAFFAGPVRCTAPYTHMYMSSPGLDPRTFGALHAFIPSQMIRGLLCLGSKNVQGNIYRAEILFKAAVHPEVKGSLLTAGQFDRVWQVRCLRQQSLQREAFHCRYISLLLWRLCLSLRPTSYVLDFRVLALNLALGSLRLVWQAYRHSTDGGPSEVVVCLLASALSRAAPPGLRDRLHLNGRPGRGRRAAQEEPAALHLQHVALRPLPGPGQVLDDRRPDLLRLRG
eukprot:SAG22_NODE_490_length_9834_cov_7.723780_9_plen_403_part_00